MIVVSPLEFVYTLYRLPTFQARFPLKVSRLAHDCPSLAFLVLTC